MEFRSDLRLTLKSSCDSCTASKVKCSGEEPCTRCVKKGISCFYSPKKKRGRVKKRERSGLVSNSPMVARTEVVGKNRQLSSLGSHERRSWSVFFTLYKHYAVSCSLFWFNRQLHKMRQYLLKQEKTDALRRLSSWMEALNIDEDELAIKVEACSLKIREWGKEASREGEKKPIPWGQVQTARDLNKGSPFHLRVKGERQGDTPAGPVVADGFMEDPNVPYIHFQVDYTRPSAHSKVVANGAFAELMGYDGSQIEKDLEESGGGFLPWGGDVLSRILITESDLLSFVQILAIKFNTMGKPTEYPIVRQVPSVHIFTINHKNVAQDGPIQAMIKCTHRETISDEQSTLDVFMSFSPVDAAHRVPSAVVVDREVTTIDGDVQLPPSKLRRQSSMKREAARPGPLPQQVSFDQSKSTIYDYAGVKADIAELSEEGESFILPPFRDGAEASPPPPSPQPLEMASSPQTSPDMLLPLSDEYAQSPPTDSAEAAAVKAAAKLPTDEGGMSPDPAVYGNDQAILESLPFVDSDEEKGSGDTASLDIDDGEWLDELLQWAGPVVTDSAPPAPPEASIEVEG